MFSYKKYYLIKTIQLKTAMALCFGHITRTDQSESFKTKSDHVTHKVNINWPIRSQAILHMCFCLDEVINNITPLEFLYKSKENLE